MNNKRLKLALLLGLFATHTMAQENYGVVLHNPVKDNYQRADDMLTCKEMAKTGVKMDSATASVPPHSSASPAPTPVSAPAASIDDSDSSSTAGTVVAGVLGGALGGALLATVKNIASISSSLSKLNSQDTGDNFDAGVKQTVFASCMSDRGYTVLPPANLDRFPQDTALPPEYVREKPFLFFQYEGWELYAKNPNDKTYILAQAIDKKLIPNLAAYVKLFALKQTTKAEKFDVAQTKPYTYGGYKGYSFEGKATARDDKVHITDVFLDVGSYILIISAVSPLDSYQSNAQVEKDLPKYFIPTLTAGK